MAKLVLKEFRCEEETSELGSDSPYFVIFHGRPSNPSAADVTVVRKDAWDNEVDSGELWTPNVTVSSGIDTGTLVMVALLEEDWDRDVAGSELTHVKDWMRTVFTAYSAGGSASLSQIAADIKPEFHNALQANTSNDDLVDIHRLTVSSDSGLLPLVHFYGAGGHYKVRFEMV